jgi:hypothetical protein
VLNCRDYRERAEEDFYDPTNLDDGEYDDLDPETRRRVEAQLNKRDREIARRGLQRPPAFLDSGKYLFLHSFSANLQRTNLSLPFLRVVVDTTIPNLLIPWTAAMP